MVKYTRPLKRAAASSTESGPKDLISTERHTICVICSILTVVITVWVNKNMLSAKSRPDSASDSLICSAYKASGKDGEILYFLYVHHEHIEWSEIERRD